MADKKRQSLEMPLPPSILYIEELDEIFMFLNSNSKGKEILSIETSDYTFKSVDDFKHSVNGKTLHELSISIGEVFFGRLNLYFSPMRAEIKVSNSEDSSAVGVAYKIKNVIESQAVKTRFLSIGYYLQVKPKLGWFICLVFPTGIALLGHLIGKDSVFIFISILILYVYSQYRLNFKEYSTIHVCSRTTRNSFLSRNKDQIILSIISAFLGAIFVVLLQNLHWMK